MKNLHTFEMFVNEFLKNESELKGYSFTNENQKNLPFTNDLLQKVDTIGNKYALYADDSTGWGIIFPNGHIEVEEGPHESMGFMNGTINGVDVSAKSREVPRIPDEYWSGEMTKSQLARFFDSVIRKYKNITG